jgi:hypothetical protein
VDIRQRGGGDPGVDRHAGRRGRRPGLWYLPEARQVNPGAYGFELALWLSNALMQTGIITSYPMSEDWGWFIEYSEGDAEFMIGCGCAAGGGDGYRGQSLRWSAFVQQVLSLEQRW